MPGTWCTVAVCNNSLAKTKSDPAKQHVVYHVFPKEKAIREVWMQRCRRDGKWNPDSCRVCSEHFTPDDYERDKVAELLNLPAKKILKKTAVPSVNLDPKPQCPKTQEATKARHERQSRQSRRKEAHSLLQEACQKDIAGKEAGDVENVQINDDRNTQVENSSAEVKDLKARIEFLAAQVESSKLCIQTLEDKLMTTENEKNKSFLETKQLKRGIKRQRYNKLWKTHSQNTHKLQRIFTKSQLSVLFDAKTKCHWDQESIAFVFTLRYLSKRTYLYLRNTLKFPLPGISSLQRWAAAVNMRNGILNDILTVMKAAAQGMDISEKVIVLCYDESEGVP